MDTWTEEEIDGATVVTDDAEQIHYLETGLVVRKDGDAWKVIGRWDPPTAMNAEAHDSEEEEAEGEQAEAVTRKSITVIPIDAELAEALGVKAGGHIVVSGNGHA